jgi:hypothetical protein
LDDYQRLCGSSEASDRHQPPAGIGSIGQIERVDRLGGVIHEYRHAA